MIMIASAPRRRRADFGLATYYFVNARRRKRERGAPPIYQLNWRGVNFSSIWLNFEMLCSNTDLTFTKVLCYTG